MWTVVMVFVGIKSVRGTRSSGRSTSAQNKPFSAIPRNSVTRTSPRPHGKYLPDCCLYKQRGKVVLRGGVGMGTKFASSYSWVYLVLTVVEVVEVEVVVVVVVVVHGRRRH